MRVCAKNVGGAYARGGAYLRDTTVFTWVYKIDKEIWYCHFLIILDYLLNGIIQVSECLNFSGNAVDNSW